MRDTPTLELRGERRGRAEYGARAPGLSQDQARRADRRDPSDHGDHGDHCDHANRGEASTA